MFNVSLISYLRRTDKRKIILKISDYQLAVATAEVQGMRPKGNDKNRGQSEMKSHGMPHQKQECPLQAGCLQEEKTRPAEGHRGEGLLRQLPSSAEESLHHKYHLLFTGSSHCVAHSKREWRDFCAECMQMTI